MIFLDAGNFYWAVCMKILLFSFEQDYLCASPI